MGSKDKIVHPVYSAIIAYLPALLGMILENTSGVQNCTCTLGNDFGQYLRGTVLCTCTLGNDFGKHLRGTGQAGEDQGHQEDEEGRVPHLHPEDHKNVNIYCTVKYPEVRCYSCCGLKRVCHEIFFPHFFYQSISSWPLTTRGLSQRTITNFAYKGKEFLSLSFCYKPV